MDAICSVHGVVLDAGMRCSACMRVTMDKMAEMDRQGIHVTACITGYPPKVTVGGIERPLSHDGEYVELVVPATIAAAIYELVKAQTEAFEATCECAACVMKRAKVAA